MQKGKQHRNEYDNIEAWQQEIAINTKQQLTNKCKKERLNFPYLRYMCDGMLFVERIRRASNHLADSNGFFQ
jgi:hypothetical protein